MTMVKTMMIRCGPLVVDAIPIQTWLSFPTRVQIFYHHVDVGHWVPALARVSHSVSLSSWATTGRWYNPYVGFLWMCQ